MTETENPLQEEEEQSTCRKIVNTLKQDWVLILTVVGIIVGFIVGLAIRPANPSDDVLMWIGMNPILFFKCVEFVNQTQTLQKN